MSTIVSRLQGGLGNQLFQYAFGRELAIRWNVPLLLDIRGYTIGASRDYALGPYNLSAGLVSTRPMQLFQKTGILGRVWDRFAGRKAPRRVNEAYFQYDSGTLIAQPPLILDGYWQSERYFLSIRPELLKQLTVGLTGENATLAHEIQEKNSVAVHVRRGDYLSNPAASTFHGVCDPEYYRRAANEIEQQVAPAHYYFFGDDPEWAKENLDFLRPATIVNLNSSKEAHLDLELMRRCKHHIIANSTFSWWGAWLSDAENKIVISPSCWFLDETIDTRDLIPASWIRL